MAFRPDASWKGTGPLTRADVQALTALWNGKATPREQLRARDLLLHRFARIDDLSFCEDSIGGERASCFAEGRRFVGLAWRQVAKNADDQPRSKDGN